MATKKTAINPVKIDPEQSYPIRIMRDRWNLSTSAAYALVKRGVVNSLRLGDSLIRIPGSEILRVESGEK